MTLRAKLILTFLFMSMLMMVLVATQQLISLKHDSLVQEMLNEHDISVQLGGLSSAARQLRLHEEGYVTHLQNPSKREVYNGQFNQVSDQVAQFFARLKSLYTRMGKTAALNNLAVWENSSQTYINGFKQLNEKVVAGKISDSDKARSALGVFDKGFNNLQSSTAIAIEQQYQINAAKADIITRFQQNAASIFIAVAAICLLLSLSISFWMPARVTRPLRKLTEAANRISKGQVNEKVVITGSLEYMDLAKSIKRLQTATDGLLKRVQGHKLSSNPSSRVA